MRNDEKKWLKIAQGKSIHNPNPTEESTDEIKAKIEYNYGDRKFDMKVPKPKPSEKDDEKDKEFIDRVTKTAKLAFEDAYEKVKKMPGMEGFQRPNMSISSKGNIVTITIGPMPLKDLEKFGSAFDQSFNNYLNPKKTANQQNTPTTPITLITGQSPETTNPQQSSSGRNSPSPFNNLGKTPIPKPPGS